MGFMLALGKFHKVVPAGIPTEVIPPYPAGYYL